MDEELPPLPADEFPEPIHVTDTLDLHGFFPEQVDEVMDEFIRHARELGLDQLKIIHGKGKSRMKYEVLRCLKNNPHVLTYKDAPPWFGGWGATLVELK